MKCGQCDRDAIWSVGGNPFCLHCYEILHRILAEEDAALVRRENHLLAEMESIAGLPPGFHPREQVPPAPVHLHGSTTVNNIKVDRSIVGAINTGNIEKLNVAMRSMTIGGNDEASKAFKEFAEAILAAKDLEDHKRNELLEHLSFLAEQATTKKKSTVAKTVWTSFKDSVQVIASLATIYTQYGPVIERIFQ